MPKKIEYQTSRSPKPGRTVPNKILDTILGKSQKKGTNRRIVADTRNSGGNVMPRGGRFLEQSSQEQLDAGVGGMPQPGPSSRGQDIYNEEAMGRRERASTSKDGKIKGMEGLIQDTIASVGKDKFMNLPMKAAGEILGMDEKITPRLEERYRMLTGPQKAGFWRKQSQNSDSSPESVFEELFGEGGEGMTADEAMEDE